MTRASTAPRTCLVTGAAGFIGSFVTEALLRRGDRVVGLDNFDPFYDAATKRRNIAWSCRQPGFRFVEGDIQDGAALGRLFGQHSFDVVVHLAARAGVRPSILDPLTYDAVNVVGTTTVLEQVRQHGVPHAVLASSSSVYGATSTPPFHEDDPADRPSSPYAATKRANEVAAYAFHHLYGMSLSCLRFFTVYGPRQRPEMAIHKFTRLVDSGLPVPVFGDGLSRRDYTYIDDVVAGVLAAVDRPLGYRIYNLGTTETIQLRHLVEKIGSRVGKPVTVSWLPAQDGDVPLTHADISRAQDELDYHPTTRLDDGLDAFLDWYRAERPPLALPVEIPVQDADDSSFTLDEVAV